MLELNGLYAARVVNNIDPTGRKRLRIQIPDLLGFNAMDWAEPGDPTIYKLPKNQTQVMVTFRNGEPSKPVWWGGNGETAVPGQVAEVKAYTDSVSASSANSLNINMNNLYVAGKGYSDLRTIRARATKTSSFSVAAGIWTNVFWTATTSPWDDSNLTSTDFVRTSDTTHLDVPGTGLYVYSATMAFAPITGANYYGMRALWRNSGQDYVIAQTGPYPAAAFFEPIMHLSFVTTQTTTQSIRFQVRSSAASTILQDNFLQYSEATRTLVECVCIKRFF